MGKEEEQALRDLERAMPAHLGGCGDHSCVVRKPEGMGTNGGCNCGERVIRWAAIWWRHQAIAERASAGKARREGAEDMRERCAAHAETMDEAIERSDTAPGCLVAAALRSLPLPSDEPAAREVRPSPNADRCHRCGAKGNGHPAWCPERKPHVKAGEP